MKISWRFYLIYPVVSKVVFIVYFPCIYGNSNSSSDPAIRPLQVGDFFTAHELLPVASKLINHALNKGRGRGIVSGARNAEDLCDKLFQALFKKSKRFSILRAVDIDILDALQALAICGEPVKFRGKESIQRRNYYSKLNNMTDLEEAEHYLLHKESIHTLITKKANATKAINPKKQQMVRKFLKKVPLHNPPSMTEKPPTYLSEQFNKMLENHQKGKRKKALKSAIESPIMHHQLTEMPELTTKDPYNRHKNSKCRWMYHCKEDADIRSCHVREQCDTENIKAFTDEISLPHREIEHEPHYKEFRKMRINLIDEEVEKIIERVHLIMPSRRFSGQENVQDYFNKVISGSRNKLADTTTAMSLGGPTADEPWSPEKKLQFYKRMAQLRINEHVTTEAQLNDD
ncbi:uncharacterized protein LOC113231600 isoform X2 [Hyposmocoma kahamanoa]|uniref:uncharacterized protein LOC113231600 isoform X2 n=1 Tax=Hyposmocoma kahamanoa TaxID=1477025 RepID=UPI000E6D9F68|nr:uncharacterized protein LOC113231600 isoform X2 [Hyposmocoma kahamanoa]